LQGDIIMPNNLVITLENNEEIVSTIKQAFQEHNLDFGTFYFAEGSLKDFMIKSDEMEKVEKLDSDYSIDKISGKILKFGGELKIRLHVTLLRRGVKSMPISGELVRGTVNQEAKIGIAVSDLSKIIA